MLNAQTLRDHLPSPLADLLPAATLTPQQLSQEWRQSSQAFLPQRRKVAGCSLLAAGAMGVIALYQMGIIPHLPEPPLPFLNADKVDASAEAYSRFATPDAALGVTSYAVTLLLAAMGSADRATTQPALPLALAAKMLFDVAQAGRLTVDQWTKQRAFCFWCLVAAGATFVSAPAVFPETRAAWQTIRR